MAPNEKPRFVVDSMLGHTARLLRCCGFDTLYVQDDPFRLAQLAETDRRIILTASNRLATYLKHRVRFDCAKPTYDLTARDSFEDSDGSDEEEGPIVIENSTRFYVLQEKTAREQVAEVIRKWNVKIEEDDLFSRCTKCNASAFKRVDKDAAKKKGISDRTLNRVSEFFECGGCGQIFWEGKQWESAKDWMQKKLIDQEA
mmetsp:Transcript_9010/g.14761  ORF Transcript_9010/g.14761 Transcript_9010/m.14761 type:complete len:200 (+) Transcript_9010:105-704(+)|eukprot:CAMPEP_0184664734 /NCGR_PEP_ID=MMETSP0308-20130426/54184_1 /TAXON_ID=38269 /ORGANISM="Gloeochaete witrockiana, Strain SAG 46.84" /LENGTH=199 /DNA_ID=CAMNT_0027108315 /DNA_START=28 /DNA_END=627 /DNA_ORIENTATION=-